MREHRPSESRRKRRRQLAHICIFTFYKTFYSTVLYYSSHYSKTFTRLSLFLSSSSLTSRSTSTLLLSRSTRRRPLYSSMKVFVSSRGWCSHHHRSFLSSRRPLSTGRASPPSLDETLKTRRLRIQSKTSTRVRVFASSPRLRISDFSSFFVGKQASWKFVTSFTL